MMSSSTETCVLEQYESVDYLQFYRVSMFITGLICYPIICVYGLVGNCLILVVMSRKSMQSSTNVYLSALAVSDTLKLVNDLLYSGSVLLTRLSKSHGDRMFRLLYPNSHFISNMSTCVSSWLTVSVAVERFILVCHPTRSVSLVTRGRALIISVMCYIVMTFMAVPLAFRYEVNLSNVTSNGSAITLTRFWCQNKYIVDMYTMLQNMLRSSIPLVILVFMNTFIINALRKTRANKKMASRNRITVLLCIVIVAFLICVTPDALMSGVFGLGYIDASNLVRGIREFTDLLLVINAAVNFTLYMLFNKVFREQFWALFARDDRQSAYCGRGLSTRRTSRRSVANSTPALRRQLSAGSGGGGYHQITRATMTGSQKLPTNGSIRFHAKNPLCVTDDSSDSSALTICNPHACVKETRDL